MTATTELSTPVGHTPSPRELSGALLSLELRRLRLLLRRHVLWLRRAWSRDPFHASGQPVISDTEAEMLFREIAGEEEEQFLATDADATHVAAELRAVSRALAAGRAELDQIRVVHPLDRLAQLFRLTSVERDVVLLCAAPDLDPSFERLYAYAQDDVERRRPTLALALSLFTAAGMERDRARDALGPAGTLRRQRVITLDDDERASTAIATRPLRTDERIVDYLRGVNHLDARVVDLVRPLEAPLLTATLAERALKVAVSLASSLREGVWPVVNIVGDAGWGRREVARVICGQLALRPTCLNVEALAGTPARERAVLVQLLQRESVLLHLGYYIEGDDGAGGSDLADSIAAPVLLASSKPGRGRRPWLHVELRAPTALEQRRLWRDALGDEGALPDDAIAAVVEQFDLGPTMIADATRVARRRAAMRAPDARVDAGDLWTACRDLTASKLHELAQRIEPRYDWADLVLPDGVVRHLRDVAAQVAHRARVYEDFGFGAKLSRGRGISALFAGPSGTGKTMAAEVIARDLSRRLAASEQAFDLYRIDLSAVIDKYVGETEKRLRCVFDAAERSGAILFFDEADALFGKRSDVKDSHDRYANIEIDYLLQRMEDYRGLAILATNRKAALDRAFLRRLRFLIDFPFPDVEQRRRIWRGVFPKTLPAVALDFEFLARLDLSGGNIRNVALNAAFLAAQEGVALGMRHLVNAASREMAKIDKIVGPAEFGRYQELLA